MPVRVIEMITKPKRASDVCRLLENWALPLAQIYPGFCEGMCLVLSAEPRMLSVFTRWESEADAEWYFSRVYPGIVSMLQPLVDQITIRAFSAGVVVPAAHPQSPGTADATMAYSGLRKSA